VCVCVCVCVRCVCQVCVSGVSLCVCEAVAVLAALLCSPSVLGHGCLLGSCRLESGSHTSQRASTGGNAFCVCVCVCVCVLGGGEQLSDSLCGTYCARDSALSLSLSISVSLFAWKPCLCSSGHPCACAQGPFRPSLPHQGRSSPRQTRCNSPANRTQVAPRAPSRLAAWSLVPMPTIPGSQRPHPAWFPTANSAQSRSPCST
jgi:hypothetical protein